MSFKEICEEIAKEKPDTAVIDEALDDNPDLVSEVGIYDEEMEETDDGKIINTPIWGTLLTLAAKNGRTEIVRSLIDGGAKVGAVETTCWSEAPEESSTCLYLAVWANSLETVRLLVESGAEVDATSGTKELPVRPLEEAVSRGLTSITKLLLDSGAEVASSGTDLICKAISGGHTVDIVKLLIDSGASVNGGGSVSQAPLVVATRCNCPDIVQLLLDRGAKLDDDLPGGDDGAHVLELTGFAKGKLGDFVNAAEAGPEREWRKQSQEKHQQMVDTLVKGGALQVVPGSTDHIRALFRQFDLNGNGTIEREELTTVMQTLDKEAWTQAKVDELLKAADLNKDGAIQFDEFISWIFGDDDPAKKV